MSKTFMSMDGNTAAATAAYMFTEVAAIDPITPPSPMAEVVDQWSTQGRKNVFGTSVKVAELQAEGGAAGAVHGALQGGDHVVELFFLGLELGLGGTVAKQEHAGRCDQQQERHKGLPVILQSAHLVTSVGSSAIFSL